MAKPKQDLTASRWASPEVRREREFQTKTRTPSPHKLSQTQTAGAQYQYHANNGSAIPTTATTAALAAAPAPLLPVGGTGATATATPGTPKPASAAVLSIAQRQYLARQTELQRFRRLFRRLAWKANSLTHWSHRALSLAQEFQNQTTSTSTSTNTQQHGNGYSHGHPTTSTTSTTTLHGPRASLGRYEMVIDPIEAERQFKIDFFEFYTLLERGLVCLLAVWGIVITSAVAPTSRNRLSDHHNSTTTTGSSDTIIGDSRTFHGVAHRFHANVLDALDHPSNPLYQVLGAGSGDARAYIGVAKEFRNKWKDVEQRPDDSFFGDERVEEEWDRAKVKRDEKVLQDLRLDELLGTVLAALEEAGKHAEAEVGRLENMLGNSAAVDARNSRRATAAAADTAGGGQDGDFDMMDAPFEVASGIAGVAVAAEQPGRDHGNGNANGYAYGYEYRYDHDYDEMEF
ncbi:hypothetical protein ABEF95_010843 [Exophiala dermatitidis]